VSDLVDGLMRLMGAEHTGPMNLGNPAEFTIRELADQVRQRINPALPLIEKPLPSDDPRQRQPDIGFAKSALGWEPTVSLEQGLGPTIDSFRNLLELQGDAAA
jgi:UDP-glucuronate decarboxylase